MPARKHRPGKHGTPAYSSPTDELVPPITSEERLLVTIFGGIGNKSVNDTVREMRLRAKEGDRPSR